MSFSRVAAVLLLCGAQDSWSPPERHAAISRVVQRGQLQIIEGAGHMLPMEQPRIMARAISQARSGSLRTSPSGSEISSSPIRVLKKYRGIDENLTSAGGPQPGPSIIFTVPCWSRQGSTGPKITIRAVANNRDMLDPTLF